MFHQDCPSLPVSLLTTIYLTASATTRHSGTVRPSLTAGHILTTKAHYNSQAESAVLPTLVILRSSTSNLFPPTRHSGAAQAAPFHHVFHHKKAEDVTTRGLAPIGIALEAPRPKRSPRG